MAGAELWTALTDDYVLEAHELIVLESAAKTVDLIAALEERIASDGAVSETGKTHSAVIEVRQQRLTLARLLTALRIPVGDEDNRPAGQRRGIRGVYSLGVPGAS